MYWSTVPIILKQNSWNQGEQTQIGLWDIFTAIQVPTGHIHSGHSGLQQWCNWDLPQVQILLGLWQVQWEALQLLLELVLEVSMQLAAMLLIWIHSSTSDSCFCTRCQHGPYCNCCSSPTFAKYRQFPWPPATGNNKGGSSCSRCCTDSSACSSTRLTRDQNPTSMPPASVPPFQLQG